MAQIIQKNYITVEQNWQKELAKSFSDPISLLKHLDLDANAYASHAEARRLFPMRVPRFFASLMEKGNFNDPLLRQVLPNHDEFLTPAGFTSDPLHEHATSTPALLHKYQSRVLLIVRGGCAVNCRYCFRRHFPYQDNAFSRKEIERNIDYIATHPEINEVIFSGGDPLMAKDQHLTQLTRAMSQIPHIKRLRIHTRLPVVLPSRIDSSMLNWLENTPLQRIVVLHINHSKEVSSALKLGVSKLKQLGVTVLNQAVLLRGINDSAEGQIDLNESIFDAGILPYYLHTLDKVQGASHFDVPIKQARAIQIEVIKRLPGFMVPKLVTEIGGQPGKTPIDLHLHPEK